MMFPPKRMPALRAFRIFFTGHDYMAAAKGTAVCTAHIIA
ncbi:hypothetical protein ANACOL_01416 [Anaerotruncus colihominis DSM 17241]|uniref:Uncharacterized protein n=1 Tax=Anaerotruncus colihominis DSM 17241 TaxID=445972 RepID=B0P9L1_9FIRM|nr:hypothetical protein ANACOL_01416 [Anaerotruncus colihominis DSM 17241]